MDSILGVVESVTVGGLVSALGGYPVYFNLYVTGTGLIFGKIGGGLKEEALLHATGFILGGFIANKIQKNKQEQLRKLTPDEILKLDKANFEILYADIEYIEMVKPHFLSKGMIMVQSPKKAAEILPKVPSGVPFMRESRSIFEIALSQKKCFNEYCILMQSVIPEKVKVK